MVIGRHIILVISVLVQDNIVRILVIELLQKFKSLLQELIFLPRNVLGDVLMPQSEDVNLWVLNLRDYLVHVELIVFIELIISISIELNEAFIHCLFVGFQILAAAWVLTTPLLGVTGDLFSI